VNSCGFGTPLHTNSRPTIGRKLAAMIRALAAFPLASLAAAWPGLAAAQVAIGVGGGIVYGPVVPGPVYGLYAPVVVVPVPLYGYGAGFLYPPPRTDGLPSCYRAGRCTLADLFALGGRPDRLDRLAPTAPDAPLAGHAFERPANVPPTAEDEIRPEYRGASVPREEFRESGTPR
jgi:hypothetical protein